MRCFRFLKTIILGGAALAVLLPVESPTANAQTVRGIVQDSALRVPIAGASVALVSEAGTVLANGATQVNGVFTFYLQASVRPASLRVRKPGYRPVLVAIAPPFNNVVVTMTRLPNTLDTVRVAANPGCRQNATTALGIALWNDARASLLSAVQAAPNVSDTAKVLNVVNFWWKSDDDGRFVPQEFNDTRFTVTNTTAIRAEETARTSMENFLFHRSAQRTSDAPIAAFRSDDVILGDEFVRHHCFRVEQQGERNRDTVIVFERPDGDPMPMQVDGKLTLFGTHPMLRMLEIRYHGIGDRACADGPVALLTFDQTDGEARVSDWWLGCRARGAPLPESWQPLMPPNSPKPSPRSPDQWAEWNANTRWIGSPASVRGTVIDRSTKLPVGGVSVSVTRIYSATPEPEPEPRRMHTTTTDAFGNFAFVGIGDDQYTVGGFFWGVLALRVSDTPANAGRSVRPAVHFDLGDGASLRDSVPRNAQRLSYTNMPASSRRPVVLTVEWRR
jgi:hypothetical protein